ncbi:MULTISPECIES: hypothetical protein [Thermoanaerobacterium]|uniref:Tail fiber repeat 2 protein n=2 Tax=Thermoanaerobacterium TaxID=28895 RepID=W9E9M5_9THEO|nr:MULTISPECIES: hypothetical protein [Thermoanaerobacterium]AFK87410.1 hypothetical protein Tsac_2412 [Thermoanaerobacterium saccharolyticum JW/SL-YS485]ETO37781.1 hypothetical protein V518_2035 [Thermoanaerobacterium aotearoense SCUT27]
MAYTKTVWNDSAAPGISAPNLNHLESQYDEVKTELQKTDGTSDIKPQAKNILIQDTNNNITATNVEDALQELAGNVQTGKSKIATAITAMGQSATSTDTFDTLSSKIRAISIDANAGVGDVLSGKTFYSGGSKQTGAMPNNGAVIITPSTQNQAIPAGYHNGSGYVKGDANLVAANIKHGITVFGVTGSFSPPYDQVYTVSTTTTAYPLGSQIPLPFVPKLLVVFPTDAGYRPAIYDAIYGFSMTSTYMGGSGSSTMWLNLYYTAGNLYFTLSAQNFSFTKFNYFAFA